MCSQKKPNKSPTGQRPTSQHPSLPDKCKLKPGGGFTLRLSELLLPTGSCSGQWGSHCSALPCPVSQYPTPFYWAPWEAAGGQQVLPPQHLTVGPTLYTAGVWGVNQQQSTCSLAFSLSNTDKISTKKDGYKTDQIRALKRMLSAENTKEHSHRGKQWSFL